MKLAERMKHPLMRAPPEIRLYSTLQLKCGIDGLDVTKIPANYTIKNAVFDFKQCGIALTLFNCNVEYGLFAKEHLLRFLSRRWLGAKVSRP